ncbi:hypothetical protein C7M84_005468 [Penaeus vannamei]|uniref:Uncharacterized protein n=1 Tax=Penaeus vannamei TaxID=6689 RepID=A0A3R7QE99_PENVA|nr:hypothetical protein C7M84_005468 [Penaeus vannamei]
MEHGVEKPSGKKGETSPAGPFPLLQATRGCPDKSRGASRSPHLSSTKHEIPEAFPSLPPRDDADVFPSLFPSPPIEGFRQPLTCAALPRPTGSAHLQFASSFVLPPGVISFPVVLILPITASARLAYLFPFCSSLIYNPNIPPSQLLLSILFLQLTADPFLHTLFLSPSPPFHSPFLILSTSFPLPVLNPRQSRLITPLIPSSSTHVDLHMKAGGPPPLLPTPKQCPRIPPLPPHLPRNLTRALRSTSSSQPPLEHTLSIPPQRPPAPPLCPLPQSSPYLPRRSNTKPPLREHRRDEIMAFRLESRCVRPGRGRDNDDGAPKDHRRIPYHLKTVKSVGIEDVNEPRHGRGKECAAGDKARIKNNKVRGGDRGTGAGGPCAVRRSVNRARRGSNKSRPRLEPAAADIFSLEHLGSKLSFPSYLFSQAEAVSLSGPR